MPSGSSKEPGSSDVSPDGRGPVLEVQGNAWWLAPATAGFLSLVTMIAFTVMDGGGDWAEEPFSWGLIGVVFVFTLLREWSVKLVAGADWLRVNRRWVDTYRITHITLRGVWFGWLLRLHDADGRRVRTYISDLETNAELWALVYNGMAHSVRNGAKINNLAAGMLRLRPGFEALRHQTRRPTIPDRVAWTFLLVIAAVFGAMYLFRPDLLGPALMIFTAIVLVVMAGVGLLLFLARRRENALDAQPGTTQPPKE
ncbi:hypothetical protein [Parasphingorhabdus pacifica]